VTLMPHRRLNLSCAMIPRLAVGRGKTFLASLCLEICQQGRCSRGVLSLFEMASG
jgi:hypothetical protein